MQATLSAVNVRLSRSSCIKMINQATKNGCVGVSPQKHRGVALPSVIEKNIRNMVTFLRERQFPVFPDKVMKWTADAIEGTVYASYFPNGVLTKSWYQGWLRRMEFLRGPLCLLEETRQAWHT